MPWIPLSFVERWGEVRRLVTEIETTNRVIVIEQVSYPKLIVPLFFFITQYMVR
jgi:hypothetical protein